MKWLNILINIIILLNISNNMKVMSIDVMIPMRDGVKLHTDFDFPLVKEYKNLTAVIDRSPYGQYATELLADIYLLLDLVAVRQDMRGTKQSEGNFTLWHNAANDSYDTMQFIVNQSWSNGIVYTIGASADGIASLCDALDNPPWLKAQTVVFATSEARSMVYPGGAYRLELIEKWLNGTVPNQAANLISEVKENEGVGDWWKPVNDTDQYYRIKWPSIMWAGWYDIFLKGNLGAFDGYQYHADKNYQKQSKIVIDPLGHCQKAHKYFPKNLIEGRSVLPLFLSVDLFDHIKKPAEDVKDVTFYVMGAFKDETAPGNYWTTLDAFPQYKLQSFYLNADGTLSTTQIPSNTNKSSLSYKYDPNNPVPTVGGNNLEIPCGPLDQSEVEKRNDVLTFTTSPLTDTLAVTGPLIVRLYVSSSEVDTDFTAKLTDVSSSGESNLIQDGIVRMRWRNFNAKKAKLIEPGTIYEIEISLWNTSFVFAPGHSIRVSISSSNYPRFLPNPNTGIPLSEPQKPPIVATNTIYLSSTYPSQLLLPVVDLKDLPPHGILEPKKIYNRLLKWKQKQKQQK